MQLAYAKRLGIVREFLNQARELLQGLSNHHSKGCPWQLADVVLGC